MSNADTSCEGLIDASTGELIGQELHLEIYEWLVGVGHLGAWPDPDGSLVESYWLCNGDPDAMAAWLVENLLADTIANLTYAPPLIVDGVEYPPDQIVWYLVGLRVQDIIAGIEDHGVTRH